MRSGRRASTRSSRRRRRRSPSAFGARMADPVAMYLSDACTLPVNMAGLPGICIPCGLSEGLPVGLQLIGAPWSEADAVRARPRLRGDHGRRGRGGRVEPTDRAAADLGDAGERRPERPATSRGRAAPAASGRTAVPAHASHGRRCRMRMRIAIAGAVVGTAVGDHRLGSPPLVARPGAIDPDEATKAAAGRRRRRRPGRERDPWDHDRCAAGARSGRGSSRWASAGPAGTATTGSTRAARAPTGSSRRGATLEVGDIVPTHPGGGFEVVELDPGRALVLRSDTALVKAQAEAWAKKTEGASRVRRARRRDPGRARGVRRDPRADPAAVRRELGVRPRADRAAAAPGSSSGSASGSASRATASHVVMPVVGFGVFVMMQRQMVGIKARAERLARERGREPVTPPVRRDPRRADGAGRRTAATVERRDRAGARDGDHRLTPSRPVGRSSTGVRRR